jgi:hypothetical protein
VIGRIPESTLYAARGDCREIWMNLQVKERHRCSFDIHQRETDKCTDHWERAESLPPLEQRGLGLRKTSSPEHAATGDDTTGIRTMWNERWKADADMKLGWTDLGEWPLRLKMLGPVSSRPSLTSSPSHLSIPQSAVQAPTLRTTHRTTVACNE